MGSLCACAQSGRTPLHIAALRGHTEAAAALCAHGADVNARDEDGAAPLHKAVVHCHRGTVEALIACRADARLALPVRAGS
jgi:ankyrin repeat protein